MAVGVKTAISMQKELFEKVNQLAEELNVSRSKLFVMAVQDFILKYENRDLLTQINNAFNDPPDGEEYEVQGKMRQKQVKNLESEAW